LSSKKKKQDKGEKWGPQIASGGETQREKKLREMVDRRFPRLKTNKQKSSKGWKKGGEGKTGKGVKIYGRSEPEASKGQISDTEEFVERKRGNRDIRRKTGRS